MNVQLIRADVKKSANSIETAANNVKGIDLEGPMAEIASALPTGQSVGAANGLKSEWKSDKDTWVKDAQEHHRVTVADANHIAETDQATAQTGDAQRNAIGRRTIERMGPV